MMRFRRDILFVQYHMLRRQTYYSLQTLYIGDEDSHSLVRFHPRIV